MKDWLKDSPVEAFPIPPGVVFAKIKPTSGGLTGSREPSAISVAFAGEVPKLQARPRRSGPKDSATDSGRPATSESFFKSDLF
jgi:hypothetical protein